MRLKIPSILLSNLQDKTKILNSQILRKLSEVIMNFRTLFIPNVFSFAFSLLEKIKIKLFFTY